MTWNLCLCRLVLRHETHAYQCIYYVGIRYRSSPTYIQNIFTSRLYLSAYSETARSPFLTRLSIIAPALFYLRTSLYLYRFRPWNRPALFYLRPEPAPRATRVLWASMCESTLNLMLSCIYKLRSTPIFVNITQ